MQEPSACFPRSFTSCARDGQREAGQNSSIAHACYIRTESSTRSGLGALPSFKGGRNNYGARSSHVAR